MNYLGLTGSDLEMVKGMEGILRGRVLKSAEQAPLQALLWWVIERGSMEQLRSILAAGADPNFIYNDGNTALGLVLRWRSEKHGAVDFFRELIRAGADPARSLGNKTLMAVACEAGNTTWAIEPLLEASPRGKMAQADLNRALLAAACDASLTRRLLQAGAAVNHLQRTSSAFVHVPVSALMFASFCGSPEVVGLLLAAGAEVKLKDEEGHTALDYALTNCSAGEPAAFKKRCREVIRLLENEGAITGRPFPEDDDACKGFAAAARKPPFKSALANIKQLTGLKPRRLAGVHGTIPGGYGFLLDDDPSKTFVEGGAMEYFGVGDRARQFVEQHQAETLAQGAYLFHTRDLTDRNGTAVALLPTTDVYRVIAAVETEGANSDVYNDDLLAWLRELEKDHPFRITGIGTDFLEGTFLTPIQDPTALVKRINEICPDLDDGPGTEERHIAHLLQTNRFFLWWD